MNKSFILFSVKDTQAADSTEHVRLYSPDEYFNNGKAVINIASSLNDVTAFYDVIANGKLVESKHLSLSNSAQNFTYDYKQEYGDGISVVLAFMKDGKLYNQNITIKKAVPEKTLSSSGGLLSSCLLGTSHYFLFIVCFLRHINFSLLYFYFLQRY